MDYDRKKKMLWKNLIGAKKMFWEERMEYRRRKKITRKLYSFIKCFLELL